MKTTLPLLSLVLLLAISPTQAAAPGARILVSDVRVAVLGTPVVQAQVPGMTIPKRPRPIGQGEPAPVWLEVEADFETGEEYPEMTVRFGLLIATATGPLKMVEGESTLIDVGRGKDRHCVMYLAPKTLNKINGGKPFTPTQIKASWVEILVQNEQFGGKFKPFGSINQSGKPLDYPSIQEGKAKGQVELLAEGLINKQHTPFAPLFWDYYEAVKPGSR